MKKFKIALLGMSLLLVVSSFAQKDSKTELKPFKVDVSLGYAIPMGSTTNSNTTTTSDSKSAKGGILFVVEPKYAVMPNISVGLRLEGALLLKLKSFTSGTADEYEVKASSSYLATGDYYFMDDYSFRPFAGLGLGIFSLASANQTSVDNNVNGTGVASGTKFGQMVRAGFETGHFRLGIEYNIVPKTTITYSTYTQSTSNSYLGLKLGVCIGGGRK